LPAYSYKHPGNSSPAGTAQQAMGQFFNPAFGSLLFKCIAASIKNGIKN
jgi:hypothetical protein